MPEHSPTPWKSDGGSILDAEDEEVATVFWSDVDRALIVRAVNAHEALVAALREIVDAAEEDITIFGELIRKGIGLAQARAALALVDGAPVDGPET